MADFVFPLEELMHQVVAEQAANGITVPHYFGAKGKALHGRPPRYVWVPTHTSDRNDTPVRAVDEYRTIFSCSEHLEIYCFGRSFKESWALRQNLMVAMNALANADVEMEGGQWARPGEAMNQDGECVVVRVSLNVPIPDAYVEIPASGELENPEQPTATVSTVEQSTYSSPDTATDGELGLTVTESD